MVAPPLPTPCTVEHALRYYADLRAPVSKQMLALLASAATEPAEADRLRHLASAGGKAEYATYIVRDGRGLNELLQTFPSATPPLGALLELVPKLTPRYYTISSSPPLRAAPCTSQSRRCASRCAARRAAPRRASARRSSATPSPAG